MGVPETSAGGAPSGSHSCSHSAIPSTVLGPERRSNLPRVTKHGYETPKPRTRQDPSGLLPFLSGYFPVPWEIGVKAQLHQLTATGPRQATGPLPAAECGDAADEAPGAPSWGLGAQAPGWRKRLEFSGLETPAA